MRYASIACAMMLLSTLPSAWAASKDITDAMTSPDPRTKLKSGTGQVYHSRYGQPEDRLGTSAEELDLNVPEFGYQRTELYDRSPLDEEPFQDLDNPDAMAGEHGPDELPPLGMEQARPGVYYQEDLHHRR